MPGKEEFAARVREWEYCYCPRCRRIRTAEELTVNDAGIFCARCGEGGLESPGWVVCPHHKVSAVKCPRGGKGLSGDDSAAGCRDRCHFREVHQE